MCVPLLSLPSSFVNPVVFFTLSWFQSFSFLPFSFFILFIVFAFVHPKFWGFLKPSFFLSLFSSLLTHFCHHLSCFSSSSVLPCLLGGANKLGLASQFGLVAKPLLFAPPPGQAPRRYDAPQIPNTQFRKVIDMSDRHLIAIAGVGFSDRFLIFLRSSIARLHQETLQNRNIEGFHFFNLLFVPLNKAKLQETCQNSSLGPLPAPRPAEKMPPMETEI